MRRWLCLLVIVIILLSGCAAAEPLGFELVNTDKTNFRKSIGCDIAYRLDRNALVYIAGHDTDARGRQWYHIITYAPKGHGRSAWVMADYVDAGDRLFSDIVQVAACGEGMLALRSDGTVTGVSNINAATGFDKTIHEWRDIRQVCCYDYLYLALDKDGRLMGCGNHILTS